MLRVIIVFVAIVPPLLVLGYGIAKARGSWRSEAIWNAFFVGAVSALVAIACEFMLSHLVPMGSFSPLVSAAASAVLIAAIPEETIKFFVLLSFCENHVDARRLQDVIVLALAVSLGFATVENFLYVTSVGDWRLTASLRAMTAVPAHGVDGLAMGALLTAARLGGSPKYWRIAAALAAPVTLHAAYDFPLFTIEKTGNRLVFGSVWLAVLIISPIVAIVLSNRVLPRAVAADRKSGRDSGSFETTDLLIGGGFVALATVPVLGAAMFFEKGSSFMLAAIVLSFLPIALGIDAIRTGFGRRKAVAEHRQTNLNH